MSEAQRNVGAVAASCMLHVAAIMLVGSAPPAMAATEARPDEIEFSFVSPPEPTPPAPEIEPEDPEPPIEPEDPEPPIEPEPPEAEPPQASIQPEPAVVPPPRVRPRPMRPEPTPPEPADETEEPETPPSERQPSEPAAGGESSSGGVSASSVPDVPTAGTPAARSAEELAILLDPSAVARRAFRVEGPGPSQRQGPQDPSRFASRGPSEEEIERQHSDHLRAVAMEKAYTRRSPPIRPRPRPDGTHVWEGPRFTAVIQRDGSVRFNDRDAVELEGASLSGRFDLTDMVMGASGQDPLSAERERFMEATEELRIRIEREWQEAMMTRALRRLRGQLARVWADSARSPQSRRREIFDLWDEMDEGGGDGGARDELVDWVVEQLPAGSEDAYTTDELRSLNANRQSTAVFRPYR